MRQPLAAGRFYPEDKERLERIVRSFLVSGARKNMRAGIVPHAGYLFSGRTAGKVFSILPEKKIFILLGVNHSGVGKKVCISLDDWETPMGIVRNDKELGIRIFERLGAEKIEVEINEKAHSYEHSIEVELPFLQLSQKQTDIVPIIFKNLDYEECRKIGTILSEFVSDEIFFLVSSDFTHYGGGYGFTLFSAGKDNFEKYDKDIVDSVVKLQGKTFYDKASKGTVCGIYGITILIELAKLKRWHGELISYSNSADVSGDWENVVGYVGVGFE